MPQNAKPVADSPISVTLVTGPLASGKTRMIQRWLAEPEFERALVVVMEQGNTVLQHALQVSCVGSGLFARAMGCACCNVRADLSRVLRDSPWRFARGGARLFDRVVIEAAGETDLTAVLQTVLRQAAGTGHYRVEGLVTTLSADELAVNGLSPTRAAVLAMADELRVAAEVDNGSAIDAIRGLVPGFDAGWLQTEAGLPRLTPNWTLHSPAEPGWHGVATGKGAAVWHWSGRTPVDIEQRLLALGEGLGGSLLRLMAVSSRLGESAPRFWQGSGHMLASVEPLPGWGTPTNESLPWPAKPGDAQTRLRVAVREVDATLARAAQVLFSLP